MSTVKLADNNSIAIPSEILKKLGLVPGDFLSVEEANGELVLRPIRVAVEAPVTPAVIAGKGLNDAIARKNLGIGIQFIKGIGPKLAALLEKKEIRTVEDALYLLCAIG